MNPVYCSMIHGGLNLIIKPTGALVRNCCLWPRSLTYPIDSGENFWQSPGMDTARKINATQTWYKECDNHCRLLESSGLTSMRTGMNQGLLIDQQVDLTGPARIDLTFDNSCNIACRTCGPDYSTRWQKYLEKNFDIVPVDNTRSGEDVIEQLSRLDLSNLRQLVFSGGEPLLGNEYWKVAKWLGNNVPNAKDQLTVCFQTNGTQPIPNKHFEIIEKFFLVKLHISIDGIDKQFEYLRWPATWAQVTENIHTLKESLPSNVMFLVEETLSIFNLYYTNLVDKWVSSNFSTNREGDITNHTKHPAAGEYSVKNLTQEYVDFLQNTPLRGFVSTNWHENKDSIANMIKQIKIHDNIRQQDFKQVFPEVAEFYSRYL